MVKKKTAKVAAFDFCKCLYCSALGCYDGCLYVLDAITGDTFWQFQTGAEVKSSPCVDPTNGHVYFGSHDHCLYALDILVITVGSLLVV